jgi:hypothetical protein
MARYEHLPIYKQALDVEVHFEIVVAGFSRHHKYTLGTDLRTQSRAIVALIVKATAARPACYLQLDIHNYFMRIDTDILFRLLAAKLNKACVWCEYPDSSVSAIRELSGVRQMWQFPATPVTQG